MYGRHGSVRDSKAVGSRCTKAVAMSTPVPKWRERKRNWCGTGIFGKRLTMMGKEHAGAGQPGKPRCSSGDNSPAVLSVRISTSAKTCSGVLYEPRPPLVPHSGCGLSSTACRRRSSSRSSCVGISVHGRPAEISRVSLFSREPRQLMATYQDWRRHRTYRRCQEAGGPRSGWPVGMTDEARKKGSPQLPRVA